MLSQNRRWQTIVAIVLLLGIIGSLVWGVTQKSRADRLAAEKEIVMEERDDALAAVEEVTEEREAALAAVDALTAERNTAVASLEEANAVLNPEMPEILVAYEAAFESGDYEQVRALFTEDGVLTTTDRIHGAISMDSTAMLNDRLDEGNFYRLAVFHGLGGQDYEIKDWTFKGNRSIIFRWSWDGNLNGSGLIVLRGDKIVIHILTPDPYQIPPQTFENHRPYDPDN